MSMGTPIYIVILPPVSFVAHPKSISIEDAICIKKEKIVGNLLDPTHLFSEMPDFLLPKKNVQF